MARRLSHLVALVALLALAVPTAAYAEYSVQLVTPENGMVSGTTEVQLRINRDRIDPSVTEARVRPASGGDVHAMRCVSGCDSRSPVYAFDLDPRRGDPFGTGPMANGPLELEVMISRQIGDDRNLGRRTLNLRVPGSAVSGLSASVEGEQVRVAWSRAPEPDVTGYRVERCRGACNNGGDWSSRGADQAASASSFTERVRPGTYSYRVVTLRATGGDGTIETTSSAVAVEVVEPEPVPTEPDGPGSPGSGGNGDGAPGGSDADGTGSDDGDDGGDGGDDGDRAGGRDADGTTAADGARHSSSRSSGLSIRSGRAPSVAFGRGGSGVPELPGVGDIFRGSLDYGVDDPDAADPRGDAPAPGSDDEVVLSAPGGGAGSFVGRLTDPNRIAVPIAGGLLMTAIGLHLWRWLRVPII